jgi:FkbM family methyltransferase
MYKIYVFLLKIAHYLGIDRWGMARSVLDRIKGVLSGHLVPLAVLVRGFKIHGISWRDYLVGAYEPETTMLFEAVIKEGQTIVDVGADYGYFSLLSAKLAGPRGRVFAFEPSPDGCKQYLEKNILRNNFQNIEIVQMAASDRAGKDKYFADSWSLFDIKHEAPSEQRRVYWVESVRLDDFFYDYSKPIDLIKIDVEGGEMNVLRGAHDILERNRNIKLILEIAPHIMRVAGVSPRDLLSLLRGHGFNLYWINEDGGVEEMDDRNIILRARSGKYANIFCGR